MSKRVIAFCLIIFALIVIVLTLVWAFKPSVLERRSSSPPSISDQAPSDIGRPSDQTASTSTSPSVKPKTLDPNSPEERERQAEEAAKRFALQFSARALTFSSLDQFRSLATIYPDATKEVQSYLEKQRQDLAAKYPQTDRTWGMTTNALAARLTTGGGVIGQTKIGVTVQAQQTREAAGVKQTPTYVEIVLELTRNGYAWNVSRITTQPFEP